MEYWAQRQRDTNRLARIMAKRLFEKRSPSADRLYALSKLSWITDSYKGADAGYIDSTKIPALAELLGRSYPRGTPLSKVALDAEDDLGNTAASRLILKHTGFTNFYKPYRNSVRGWLHENRGKVLPLYRASFEAANDRDRLALIDGIGRLPGIPKANHPEQMMRPEYFLTPVFFMLDPQIKFPIINGNRNVRALLAKLGVRDHDLASEYQAMVSLYGLHGIDDAADLDQHGAELPDFLDSPGQPATKQLLRHRGENERDLTLKDEVDYEVVRQATSTAHRNIHNRLTNALHNCLGARLTILEGINDCKFDAMVKRFNGTDDLLIEAKSSIELPHLRMAIGQLFHYWFQMHPGKKPFLAVLLPERPSESAIRYLNWMKVGTLWFDNKTLKTCSSWLVDIAEREKNS
jgi:hypothetical protein